MPTKKLKISKLNNAEPILYYSSSQAV